MTINLNKLKQKLKQCNSEWGEDSDRRHSPASELNPNLNPKPKPN